MQGLGGRVDERAFYSHLQMLSVNIFYREGFQSTLIIEVFNTGRIESIIASAVFDKSRPASVRQAIRPSGRIKSVNFNITNAIAVNASIFVAGYIADSDVSSDKLPN